MENELKSLARERIWFLEQVRRKAEKSVTISNGGNFICRKVRGAFQYYLNGGYVKKSEKDTFLTSVSISKRLTTPFDEFVKVLSQRSLDLSFSESKSVPAFLPVR